MLDYVSFKDDTHTYTNRDGIVYTSATTLIGYFKQPFDGLYWSLYKAMEKLIIEKRNQKAWDAYKQKCIKGQPKEFKQLTVCLLRDFSIESRNQVYKYQQDFLDKWELEKHEACDRGTQFHLEREHEAYELGYQIYPGTTIKSPVQTQYTFNLAELPDGYYTELLVYHHPTRTAGQIDRCWITTDTNHYRLNPYTGQVSPIRYIDLDDWKTNKAIKTENRYSNMLGPMSHLPDCNHSQYRGQISIYAWILKQWGYLPRKLQFTHCIAGARISYPTVFLEKEVEAMIDYHLSRHD